MYATAVGLVLYGAKTYKQKKKFSNSGFQYFSSGDGQDETVV